MSNAPTYTLRGTKTGIIYCRMETWGTPHFVPNFPIPEPLEWEMKLPRRNTKSGKAG